MKKEEKTEMLNPFCDEGFKRIFGDKILLMDFLNSFVDAGSPIVDLTYENKELVSVESDGRTIIFDLFCKLDNGMNVIIEMQNKNQDFFVDRAVFYLSRAISAQGEKGRIWKYGINSVIGIFITQFRVFDNDDVLSEMKLIDPKTNKMVSDKMHGYFIQLPKFKKSNNGCVDHFDEWIYNLKNMERMGNIEFKDQEVFERLWNLSNCSMLSIEERRKYERSLKAYRDYVNQLDFAKNEGRAEGREEGRAEGREEGRAEGREEGRAEGREEGKAEGKTEERFKIISTLKRKGKSDEEIASLLDLNIEDVKSV